MFSFRYLYFFVAMIFAVFGNSYISDYIGYTMRTTVAFTLLCIYCIYKYNKGEYVKKIDGTFWYFLTIGITIVVFHFLLGHDYFQAMLCMIFLPCFFSLFFDRLTYQELRIIRLTVIIFYISNCSMAIWEHYAHDYFIPHTVASIDELEIWSFRARAMLGHPLANVLIMSPMIVYIMSSDMKFYFRLLLLMFGVYALLCFNTRSGILTTMACCIPIIYMEIKKKKTTAKWLYTIIIFVSAVLATNYVLNNEIGGRLINLSKSEGFLTDGNSIVRIQILRFYEYIKIDDLLLGSPENSEHIMTSMGMMGIENGAIFIILYYGLLCGLPLIWILFLFYYKRMGVLSNIQRWAILLCYWGIGMTNPHIAFYLSWYYFFFDFYAFIPTKTYFTKINPQRHIEILRTNNKNILY